MNRPIYQLAAVPVAVGVGLFVVLASVALGQRAAPEGSAPASNAASADSKSAEPSKVLPPLRVYEWGVTTLHWDGTPEAEEEMPAAFYSTDRIPMEPPINRGAKPDIKPTAGTARPRKPVIYIEHDLAVTGRIIFDLDIWFPNGRVTWAYPKPNRRLDAATIQWDNLEIINEATARLRGTALPTLAKFPSDHWAAASRAGSAASLLAGNETEHYLFYEGEQFDLPELDLFRAADGSLHVQNHGSEPVFEVRINVAIEGDAQSHYLATLPAASAEKPADVALGEKTRAGALPSAGTLAKEAQAAGLTAPQAKVFEDVWRRQLHGMPGTISWRRSPKALDRMAEIRLTLPPGMSSDIKRLGYVLASRVDLARQPALDAQAAKAALGDADAAKALRQSGMAGAGAIRRLSRAETLGLAPRLALGQLLAEMVKPPQGD